MAVPPDSRVCDPWLLELEGRIVAGVPSWVVSVTAVTVGEQHIYLEISPAHFEDYRILVRLTPQTPAEEVLSRLRRVRTGSIASDVLLVDLAGPT